MLFRIKVLLGLEIVMAGVVLSNPYIGTMILLLLLFTRPQDDRPNMQELHIPMVMTISILLSIVARFGKNFASAQRALFGMVLPILYLVLMWVSALINGYPMVSQAEIQTMLVTLITLLAMLAFVTDVKGFMTVIGVMLLAGLYYVKMTIQNPSFLRSSISGVEYTRLEFRNLSNFGNPNYLALFVALLLYLALGFVTARYKKILVLPILATAAGFIYVFLKCQSRGAVLGLAGGMIVFWLTSPRKGLTLGVGGLVVGIGLIFMAPSTFFERMTTVTNYEEDASVTGRLELWGIAIGVIQSHPIFGIGPNNFQGSYGFNSEHNTYLQAATELGIPGFLLLVAMLFNGFRQCLIARRLTKPPPGSKLGSPLHIMTGALMACLVQLVLQGFFNGFAYREFFITTIMLCSLARMIAENDPAVLAEAAPVPMQAYMPSRRVPVAASSHPNQGQTPSPA